MIKIAEEYEIRADGHNYILVRVGLDKNGEKADKQTWYCTTIQHCLEVIYRQETREWIQTHDAELKEGIEAFRGIWSEVQMFGKDKLSEVKKC